MIRNIIHFINIIIAKYSTIVRSINTLVCIDAFSDESAFPLVCQVDLDLLPSPTESRLGPAPEALLKEDSEIFSRPFPSIAATVPTWK